MSDRPGASPEISKSPIATRKTSLQRRRSTYPYSAKSNPIVDPSDNVITHSVEPISNTYPATSNPPGPRLVPKPEEKNVTHIEPSREDKATAAD